MLRAHSSVPRRLQLRSTSSSDAAAGEWAHWCPSVLRRSTPPLLGCAAHSQALTYPFLHAFHGWLLLWPWHLAPDWSFESIPMVQSLADPRNLASVALYGTLFGLVRLFVDGARIVC